MGECGLFVALYDTHNEGTPLLVAGIRNVHGSSNGAGFRFAPWFECATVQTSLIP